MTRSLKAFGPAQVQPDPTLRVPQQVSYTYWPVAYNFGDPTVISQTPLPLSGVQFSKGMRMAGQLGNAQRTTRHLKVVRVDLDRNLLLINGDVPGHKNSVVLVRDSVRQPKGKK